MESLSERLSGVDRAWLRMDRATNPMVIVALIVLRDRLPLEHLRDVVQARFACHARFRSRPVADAIGDRWVTSDPFDVASHVQPARLARRGTQAQLEALVARLASTPLDPERPLWTFHLVERYGEGSAVILRIHHCYADGIALARVFLSLTDAMDGAPGGASRANAAPATPPRASHDAAIASHYESLASLVEKVVQDSHRIMERALHLALHPREAVRAGQAAAGVAAELGRLARLPDDPPTTLKRAHSGRRTVAIADPLPLADVRTIAKLLRSTINDVALATLAGALGRYLAARGESPQAPVLRAAVPVNLRGSDAGATLGNRFGLVFVDLPIAERDAVTRVLTLRETMRGLKDSMQPLVVLGLLEAVGNLPAGVEEAALQLFSRKASLVVSNVPGPPRTLCLGGARISRLLFWVPQAGDIGAGVSILTYEDALQVGVIADAAVVRDAAALARYVAEEFECLVLRVLMDVATLLPD